MRLTWRDAAGTVLVAVAAALALAVTNGWTWWFIGDFRSASVAMGILTLVICPLTAAPAFEGSPVSPLTLLVGALGVVAIAIFAWAVISGGAVPMLLFAGDMVVMWAVTTLHHLFMGEPRRALAA